MRDECGSEIGGGKGRRVQRRSAKGSRKAEPRRRAFSKKRREAFLAHFAASCNAAAAARAVGISENCIYAWRKKDSPFRDGWKQALDQGYARLEAELVRESAVALRVRTNKAAAVRVGTMDAKTALAVLEAYRRSGGRDPGTVWPQPYDSDAVAERLEAKMRALGMIGGAGGAGPSTASRPPSRADTEEED